MAAAQRRREIGLRNLEVAYYKYLRYRQLRYLFESAAAALKPQPNLSMIAGDPMHRKMIALASALLGPTFAPMAAAQTVSPPAAISDPEAHAIGARPIFISIRL